MEEINHEVPAELKEACSNADFDVMGAYYMFCVEYHAGMSCPLYRWLSYLGTQGYKPGLTEEYCRVKQTSERCQEIYARLVKEYGNV